MYWNAVDIHTESIFRSREINVGVVPGCEQLLVVVPRLSVKVQTILHSVAGKLHVFVSSSVLQEVVVDNEELLTGREIDMPHLMRHGLIGALGLEFFKPLSVEVSFHVWAHRAVFSHLVEA